MSGPLELLYRVTHQWAADPVARAGAEHFLVERTAPLMFAFLVLMGGLWGALLRDLARIFREVPVPVRWALFAIAGLGAGFRLQLPLRMPQVYFDEFNFLDAAQALARELRYCLPPPYSGGECRVIPVPPGCSFLISLVWQFTPPEYRSASSVTLALSAASIPLFFLVAWLLFQRSTPALCAALFLAVLPVHLRMAGSTSLETGSAFFLLLTLLGLLMYRRERRPAWLYAAGAAGAGLMNFRMENPLVVYPLLLGVYLACDGPARRCLRSPHLYGSAALAWLLAAPALAADWYGISTDFYLFYGSAEERARQVQLNLIHNLLYWVDNRIHPAFLTALALVGLATWRPRSAAFAWGGWVLLLHLFYSLNPSADFGLRHTIDSWRLGLFPALGVLLLASAGWSALQDRLAVRAGRKAAAAASLSAILAVLAVPFLYRGFVQQRHLWMWQYRLLEETGRRMPEGSFLLLDGGFNQLPGRSDLQQSMAEYATRHPVWLMMVPDAAFRNPGREAPPEILRAIHHWITLEKRRVFLYYLSREPSSWDRKRIAWLHDHLKLQVVAGSGHLEGRVSGTVYEVLGLTAPARRWLQEGRGP